MCFTVTDVERFKQLLKNSEPPLYKCIPPSEQSPLSPQDAFYTLYSIHEFDLFLDALEQRNEHIARYVLTGAGELCFGYEGEPGKSIAEHWQMVGDDPMIIAAGNLFVTNRKITGLSDQSPCTTGLISLFRTLRALHEHHIPLASYLDLIESVLDKEGNLVSAKPCPITREVFLKIVNQHAITDDNLDEELLDEDDVFMDGVRADSVAFNRRPTPHPFSFFYNKTDGSVSISRQPSPPHERADVPETTTTKAVVRTW